MPEASTFWDIGANVGLYSIYAAKKKNLRVIAFEPSVFNLELLARNLFLNDLQDKVTIAPLALSDGLGTSVLRMTTTEWGGALSTFGKMTGWNGESIQEMAQRQSKADPNTRVVVVPLLVRLGTIVAGTKRKPRPMNASAAPLILRVAAGDPTRID